MDAASVIANAIEQGQSELVIEDQDIVELPDNLWQMTNLESLEIRNCYNLEEIPGDISRLVNLTSFKITRSKITAFPPEFWQLTNLISLDIFVCPRIQSIPVEMELLTNLKSLKITGCETLENLPEEISNLINLISLRIYNCEKIKLPSAIYKLRNLTFLEIEENCKISENSFPKDIPADIQGSVLRVVNKAGEIIALFFGSEILKEASKMASLEEYCSYYDQLFDDYRNWKNAGINLNDQSPEEQEKEYKTVLRRLKWNTSILMRIEVKGYYFLLQKLSRLAYPYQCEVNKIERTLSELEGSISYYFNDIRVLRKAFEFGFIKPDYLMKELINTGWIYDHPEYWVTSKNIEFCLNYAKKNKDAELIAFLLDYKESKLI